MIEHELKGRRAAIAACALILAALIVRVGYGIAKTDWHVDEGITLALTNGTWMPSFDTGIFERWMEKGELEDRAFNNHIAKLGRVDFGRIYDATAHDVHPPLYYWIIAAARLAVGVRRHMAANLLVNCLCFVLSAVLLWLTMRRTVRDEKLSLLALALYGLSSAAVSVTLFMRMYELLQTECMLFLCCAAYVIFPREDGSFGASRWLCVAGLCVASFLGLLTQYYFLFFIAPIGLVAGILLIKRGEFAAFLWGFLAVLIGLYAAWRVFPVMELHLTVSRRAGQSRWNLFGVSPLTRLSSVGSFAVIAFRYMPALIAIPVSAIAAVVLGKRRRAEGAALPPAGFVAILLAVVVFTFAIISLSAPYQTLRYLVAFTPAYTMLGVCLAARLLPGRRGTLVLAAVFLLGIIPGLLPFNIGTFHEDYRVDASPEYFAGDEPIIVVSSYAGYTWKNLLLYKRIPSGRRVFVTMRDQGTDLAPSIAIVAAGSGAKEVIVIADEWFGPQRGLERVGFWGFFDVYRMKVE